MPPDASAFDAILMPMFAFSPPPLTPMPLLIYALFFDFRHAFRLPCYDCR